MSTPKLNCFILRWRWATVRVSRRELISSQMRRRGRWILRDWEASVGWREILVPVASRHFRFFERFLPDTNLWDKKLNNQKLHSGNKHEILLLSSFSRNCIRNNSCLISSSVRIGVSGLLTFDVHIELAFFFGNSQFFFPFILSVCSGSFLFKN